jgi:hypothetical protein
VGTTPGSALPVGITTSAPTAAQFLIDFPVFNIAGNPVYSLASIQFWLNWGILLLNAPRFGVSYYYCLELFVAHNLSLTAWSVQGGPDTVPGIAKGPLAGTAAGNVSVSYNTAAVLELDAGHWNYTVWGQIFIRYVRMAGAGPIYVGAGGCGYGNNAVSSGGWFAFVDACAAWNGPPVYSFPNTSNSG